MHASLQGPSPTVVLPISISKAPLISHRRDEADGVADIPAFWVGDLAMIVTHFSARWIVAYHPLHRTKTHPRRLAPAVTCTVCNARH